MKFRLRDYRDVGRIVSTRRLMQEAPWWDRPRLDDWVAERHRAIAVHAATHIPFYRRQFAEIGVDPGRCDDPGEWRRLPTIDKATVRAHLEDLRAPNRFCAGAVWGSTSGSTGMSLRFLLDRRVNAAAFAMLWRAWESGGFWRFGQRQCSLKGTEGELGWRYNRVIRTLALSTYRLNRDAARVYRDLILRFRPRFIRGYPSALFLFCRFLRELELPLHVPMVIMGSEMVHDFQRRMVEEVLGARVFNHYTHWERAASILECGQGRLHAQPDFGDVEILDGEGQPVAPGVTGEIVATGFYNLAMPLLRYRTGDLARRSAEPCPCGSSFPVVDHIEGRVSDMLRCSDGSLTATSALTLRDTGIPISYCQIIQREPNAVEVRLVPGTGFDRQQHGREVETVLHRWLGEDTRVDLVLCDLEGLLRSPAGKIRSCVNLLPTEGGGGPATGGG